MSIKIPDHLKLAPHNQYEPATAHHPAKQGAPGTKNSLLINIVRNCEIK